jgi:hypothetical protein
VIIAKEDVRAAVERVLNASWDEDMETREVALCNVHEGRRGAGYSCATMMVRVSRADKNHYLSNPMENLVGIVTRCSIQLMRAGHTVAETQEQAKELRQKEAER